MSQRCHSGHRSFDDLVSKRKQLCRRLKVERLCGLKINDQLELGWRLHREVGGLGSFEDPINVYGRLARLLCVVTAIPDKTTCLSGINRKIDCRNPVAVG